MTLDARMVPLEKIQPSRLLRSARLTEEPGEADGEEVLPPPPWWLRSREDGFAVLWRPRRDPAGERVPGVILPGGQRSDREVTLELVRRHDSFSPLEKGRALGFLRGEGWSREDLVDRAAPRLDLPAARIWVRTYLRFDTLPDALQTRLHRGDAGPRLVRYLLEIPERLRPPLLEALGRGRVHLTVQQARRLSEALRRLPRSEEDAWGEEISRREEETPRETGERWMAAARRLAFPETHARRVRFRRALEEVDPDGRIRVNPPENFEGDYLDFSLRCHRDDDVEALAEALQSCRCLLKHV